MKTFIVAMGAMVAMTLGQDLSGVDTLAVCGQNCVNSMVAKAGELGCGAGDYACLCLNADFSYGVRDCTDQSCTNQDDATAAQNWANDFCAGYGVAITSNGSQLGATETSSGASPSDASASPTTIVASDLTSTFTTVITSGSFTITSTGTFTASGFTTTVSPTVSVGSTSTSTVAESTTTETSTTTGETSGPSGSSGPGETDGGSESTESPGFAPRATAAPMGVLAAAGIMAFLL